MILAPTYVAAADGVSHDEALGDHDFGSGANGPQYMCQINRTRF